MRLCLLFFVSQFLRTEMLDQPNKAWEGAFGSHCGLFRARGGGGSEVEKWWVPARGREQLGCLSGNSCYGARAVGVQQNGGF